jgi:hypothetical protein
MGGSDLSQVEPLVQQVTNKLPKNNPIRDLATHWLAGLTVEARSIDKNDPQDSSKVVANTATLQKEGNDESNYVNNLILVRQLSRIENNNLPAETVAKNYQSLGIAYQAIAVPEFFQLPWTYFEACAVKLPKTELAEQCYGQAVSYLLGYFKAKKVEDLPNTVRKRLSQLRE